MKKAPKGTTRGVFVVGKGGKVLAAEAGVGFFKHFVMIIQKELSELIEYIGSGGYG